MSLASRFLVVVESQAVAHETWNINCEDMERACGNSLSAVKYAFSGLLVVNETPGACFVRIARIVCTEIWSQHAFYFAVMRHLQLGLPCPALLSVGWRLSWDARASD